MSLLSTIMDSASDLVDFARRNIDERGMRIEPDGEDAVKLVDKDRGVVLAKFNSVDDMVESYGPKVPDLNFGNADNYIDAINPTGSKVEDMINLNMGDMYGMLPRGATKIKSEGGVNYYKDGNDFYATTYNPDVGEEDVIGYHLSKDGSAELQVVNEMKGKGIGAELSYQFRKNNPEAPSGGLSEAGERTARKTYERLKAEGIVGGAASLGLLAASPESEAGVFGKSIDFVEEAIRSGKNFLYHSGDASLAEDMQKYGIEPQHGDWVREVLESSVDDPEIMSYLEGVPEASWYSETPNWVAAKVAKRIGKSVSEVTLEDIKKHGHLAIVDPEGDFVSPSDFYRIPEEGTDGGQTVVKNLLGEETRIYNTPLYEYDDYGGGEKITFGLEPNDIVTTESVDPLTQLTGDDLINFLQKNYPDTLGRFSSAAPVGAVSSLLATEAATPEGQLNPLLAVPAEVGSALNEAVVGTLDFLGPDTINAISELIGSEYRMPRLSDQELVRLYTQGGYMDEGYGRDAIRTATGLLSPL